MTKLFVDQILEYLRDCSRKADFEDYVFPEEMTAEYIAGRFGASKIAVLRRLRGLENDGIVVSKRAYVRGKPGKRLVFYLVELLNDYQRLGAGDDGVAASRFGYQSLIYEKISKTDILELNGDVRFTGEYKIKNVSRGPISEIPLPSVSFSTGNKKNIYDQLVEIVVDGKTLPYSSDGLRFYKKSEPGKCNEELSYTKTKHHSTVLYIVPLEEPLKPSYSVQVRLTTDLPNAFSNLEEFEYTVLDIKDITLWASLRLVAPKGYSMKLLKRYRDTSYHNGILIREKYSGIRKPDVEEKITPPKANGHSLHWVVERPVLGYQYVMPFIIVKRVK